MLYIILLLAALFCVSAKPMDQIEAPLSSDFLNKVRPKIQNCAEKNKVPMNTFNKLLQGIVDNEASLNFMFCYLRATELIHEDGHINVNNVVSLLKGDHPKDAIIKDFETCNQSSGKDHLETLRLMVKCYKDSSITFTAKEIE